MNTINRRDVMKGVALSAGAMALLRGSLLPDMVYAQESEMPPGTLVSFAKGGVKFHSYVSPGPSLNVTSQIVEFENELMLVDATMMPPTIAEIQAAISATGKPVQTALISHKHPDHWLGAGGFEGISFRTLPAIAEQIAGEADGMGMPAPGNVVGDMELGTLSFSGVPVEFRNYQNAESPDALVAVFPEQRVAIVQDLVYNGVYAAPGENRQNWIATLEGLRDDEAFDTLLVGHGMPTTRGELTTLIEYLKVFDEVVNNATSAEEASTAMMKAYPGYSGERLLGLLEENF